MNYTNMLLALLMLPNLCSTAGVNYNKESRNNTYLELIHQKRVERLKQCLSSNRFTERNAAGIPIACEQDAHDLAITGETEKVERMILAFAKYSPLPTQGK